MAYKVIILYQLYMPSYFLGTFTEYPHLHKILDSVFKIIQSRAVCNKTSKYHNQIINLLNRNMEVIRMAAS